MCKRFYVFGNVGVYILHLVGGWLAAGFKIKYILTKGLYSDQYYLPNMVVQRLFLMSKYRGTYTSSGIWSEDG